MSGMVSPKLPVFAIRPATAADIPSIRDVARRSWAGAYDGIVPEAAQTAVLDRAYSQTSLEASIARNHAFLVAETGGRRPRALRVGGECPLPDRMERPRREREECPLREPEGRPEMAGFVDLDSGGRTMTLNRLYVLPKYQRMGLGRRLFEEAVSRVLGRGVRAAANGPGAIQVVAEVVRDNPNARAFYRKLGFAEDEEEIIAIGGVSLPVIRISMTVER